MQKRLFVVSTGLTSFIGKGHPDFVDKKHPDFGKRKNPDFRETLTKAVQEALSKSAISPEAIDRLVVGNFAGQCFHNQGHFGSALVGTVDGLSFKQSFRVEAACASGSVAFLSLCESLRANPDAHVGLAAGVEVQTTVSAREGAAYLATASDFPRQGPLDAFTFPATFALRTKKLIECGFLTMEDTAYAVVKAYENAKRNPLAHMHARAAPVTLDIASTANEMNPFFLKNPDIRSFLRILDCSQVSDGAAAVVVANEEGLAKLGLPITAAVEIAATTCVTDSLFVDAPDPTRMTTSSTAAQRAFKISGLKPSDIQVAEVHDCFSVTEPLQMEALGLAPYGKATRMLRSGATRLDGSIPINTGGGLIAFGHPVGATGIKQLVEVVKQMRGESGAYQMAKTPRVGACLNMGGEDKTAVCTLLKC